MKKIIIGLLFYTIVFTQNQPVIKLPAPILKGTITVEEALAKRRSVRNYTNKPLTVKEVSQILWAAYGITKPSTILKHQGGLRTAPSAGAIYPLELYIVAGNITGLKPGIYKYKPETNELLLLSEGDKRQALYNASYQQDMILNAPASIVYSAVFEQTTQRYGQRGRERYVCMDLGHSAENVYLQAIALGLGTCAVGSFSDNDVKLVVGMPQQEEPLYIMPIGWLK